MKLPPDTPNAYTRSQLGPKVWAWMVSKGWIDNRRAVKLKPAEATK